MKRGLTTKKKHLFCRIKSVKNAQRKTLTVDEDELLLVTVKDFCYFFVDAFSLSSGRSFYSSRVVLWFSRSFPIEFNCMKLCKTIIIDDFTPDLHDLHFSAQTDKKPWKICCRWINSYTFDHFQYTEKRFFTLSPNLYSSPPTPCPSPHDLHPPNKTTLETGYATRFVCSIIFTEP